jgi:hypothetical protein
MRAEIMKTDLARCTFRVIEGAKSRPVIVVEFYDFLTPIAGQMLELNLKPHATAEQAQTFARVLKEMIANIAVTGLANDVRTPYRGASVAK